MSLSFLQRVPQPLLRPLIPLTAVLIALLFGVALVAATGASVSEALGAFAEGAWGSPYVVSLRLRSASMVA